MQGCGSSRGVTSSGGGAVSSRNLFSGNNGVDAFGVVFNGGSGNRVKGNLIGTDRSGTRALSAAQTGIHIGGGIDNRVGGGDSEDANVVSGNGIGISTFGSEGSGHTIEGNLIGVSVDGVGLGNTFEGVIVQTGQHTVKENVIAHNKTGVLVANGTGSLITRNSIFQNDGLGIELDNLFGGNDVPPESDPPDQDTGPNNLQNHPVLSSVTLSGSGTIVEGLLQSTPNSNSRIEFFANADRDSSGFGEGQTFIGDLDIGTDAAGNASFSATLPLLPSGQPFVTATATDIQVRPPLGQSGQRYFGVFAFPSCRRMCQYRYEYGRFGTGYPS